MNYGMLVSFHCVIGDSSDMLAQILGVEVSFSQCPMLYILYTLYMIIIIMFNVYIYRALDTLL